MEAKRKIMLNDYEHRVMVNALNNLRNTLLSGDLDTEPVDNILLKVIRAKGVRKRGQKAR